MLDEARRRGLYHALVESELTAYLQQQPARFNLIASADTLCYFGALETVLTAAAYALKPDGLLVFTVERLDDPAETSRLQPHGRYAHAPAYVTQALQAAGLQVLPLDAAVLRQEGGQPVHGMVATARRDA
jgi:predicted TPR repeat methyltransferase